MTLNVKPTTSPNLCTITLVGNLVNAPQIRYQANPVLAIAEMTIATHNRWFDKASNSFKEWTSYHPANAIGELAEFELAHAKKGDIILLQGYLSHSKNSAKELLMATFVQTFAKGFSQEINQLHCSGQLISPFKLNITTNNKMFAEATISITQQIISPSNQNKHKITIKRPVHIWGKQAQYLSEHSKINDSLIVEGKLNYLNNADKAQLIEAKQIILLKTTP